MEDKVLGSSIHFMYTYSRRIGIGIWLGLGYVDAEVNKYMHHTQKRASKRVVRMFSFLSYFIFAFFLGTM